MFTGDARVSPTNTARSTSMVAPVLPLIGKYIEKDVSVLLAAASSPNTK